MNRLLKGLLCQIMCALLITGCVNYNEGTKDELLNKSSSIDEMNSESTYADNNSGIKNVDNLVNSAAMEAIEERKEEGGSTVVMAFMNYTGEPAGLDRVEKRINEITEDELGITVDLQIIEASSYSEEIGEMLATEEKIDLFNAVSIGFVNCFNKGYLHNMYEDNLIEDYGYGILNIFSESELAACTISGKLYGIPVKKDDAAGQFGISISRECLDGISFDYDSMYENKDAEVIHTDLDTISSIFAKLHEKYPEKTTFYMNHSSVISQCLMIDDVGGDYFGVLENPMNSLELTDLFSSNQYRDFCKQMYEWNQAGYFASDAMEETEIATTLVKDGKLCAYKTATKPGIRQQETNLCGTPMVIFQIGDDIKKSTAYNSMPWCMNERTEDPIASMQLLNAFYTDERLATLLCWGEEGIEYIKTDDGHFTFPDGVDAGNSEYFNNVNWETPNQFLAGVWEGDSLDLWDQMEQFNDEAKTTKAMGFTWDNKYVSAEYKALSKIYSEYQLELEFGFADPEVTIPQMVDKLKAKGLNKYIKAKQEALNEWAAANGIE